MADTKYIDVASLSIGYDVSNCEAITEIISFKDRIVAPDGELTKPIAAINDKTIPDVTHHHRYVLSELVTDGFNYEAFFTEQVQDGVAASRAFRQGADNDDIEYLVAVLNKVGGGTDTRTYESGRNYLSGLHIHVSNRKGTKYQPCTFKFKTRGTVT